MLACRRPSKQKKKCHGKTISWFRSHSFFLYRFLSNSMFDAQLIRMNHLRALIDRSKKVIENIFNESDIAVNFLVLRKRGKQRLSLITKALELKSIPNIERRKITLDDYLTSLKLYFQCISDPLVTVSEIKHFLLFGLRVTLPQAEEVCDVIRKVFSELDITYKPRSLAHLSRYAARACLRKASTMPLKHSVQTLPIPGLIKSLILIDDNTVFLR